MRDFIVLRCLTSSELIDVSPRGSLTLHLFCRTQHDYIVSRGVARLLPVFSIQGLRELVVLSLPIFSRSVSCLAGMSLSRWGSLSVSVYLLVIAWVLRLSPIMGIEVKR